jgi:hypothetical protein
LPGCGHAERTPQASWWQEHGAAHDGGPRAQQAGKLETRAFAGSQGGMVAPAGGNTCAICATRSKGPVVPRPDADHTRPLNPAAFEPCQRGSPGPFVRKERTEEPPRQRFLIVIRSYCVRPIRPVAFRADVRGPRATSGQGRAILVKQKTPCLSSKEPLALSGKVTLS